MLPLLSSPFYAFFLSSTLSLWSRFLSDARVLLKYLMRPHMSRHHNHCEAAEIRDRPCPHPGLNTRSSRSHSLNPLRWRLPLALRPEVSNELLSVRACAPVTRYFMRLATSAGRPEEATSLYDGVLRRPCTTTGDLHQHLLRGRDPSGARASPTLRAAPSGNAPVSRKRHSAMSNLRATAIIPIRRTRLPPWPKRSRNHTLRALSG